MKKKAFLIGAVSGFCNGIFGSGGGSVVVPGIEKFLGIKTHKAHATAIAAILPLCAVSILFYLKKADLDPMVLLLVSTGGAAGGFIGAKLLRKLSSVWIHRIFGICMAVAAVKMIF